MSAHLQKVLFFLDFLKLQPSAVCRRPAEVRCRICPPSTVQPAVVCRPLAAQRSRRAMGDFLNDFPLGRAPAGVTPPGVTPPAAAVTPRSATKKSDSAEAQFPLRNLAFPRLTESTLGPAVPWDTFWMFFSCAGRRYPAGRYPTGRYPTGRYPAGRYPTGRYPSGRYPTGRYPTGGYPAGRYPTPAAAVTPRSATKKSDSAEA